MGSTGADVAGHLLYPDAFVPIVGAVAHGVDAAVRGQKTRAAVCLVGADPMLTPKVNHPKPDKHNEGVRGQLSTIGTGKK